MINKYDQPQLITTKQAIIESENYLQSLFNKSFPEIGPSLAQLSYETCSTIIDRSGDAKPILLLAMHTPRDVQHETITWITDGDERSAHLFYTLPLGKVLTLYKAAQKNAHRFPLRSLTLAGGLLPTGTYMRLNMQQCAVLEIFLQQFASPIATNRTDTALILAVEKDIIERLGLKGKRFTRDYLTPYEHGMTILRASKTGYTSLCATSPLIMFTLSALTIASIRGYSTANNRGLSDHALFLSALTSVFSLTTTQGYGIEKQHSLQQTVETL